MSKINIAQYIYWENETDNIVLLNARTRGNSKTTGDDNVPMLETVNFSLEAVINNDFKLDGGSCGDCPRSYNQNDGKSGKCYCHAGHERFALIRMLKQCHKLWNARKIKPFSLDAFDEWWSAATYSNIYRFLRFGRYGDPYFVGEQVNTLLYERALAAAGGNIVTTGYTHQWRREDATYLQRMMMASIDSLADYAEADRAGWRKYVAIKKSEDRKSVV